MIDKTSNIVDAYKESLARLLNTEGISPASKYIDTIGPVRKIHYLETGEGEPLILIHGGGGTNAHWYNLIHSLQKNFRLLIVDRPGCGLTDLFNYRGVDIKRHPVDFIKSFMDALGIGQSSFLANSMGGYFTVRFALSFPQRVQKIILPGVPAGLNNNIPFFMRLIGVRGLNSFLKSTIGSPSIQRTRSAFEQVITPNVDQLPQELVKCCYLGSLLPGADVAWSTLLEEVFTLSGKGYNKKYDITVDITGIQNPVLFIWGDKDVFAAPAVGETAVKQMTNARLAVIQNAGHQPWWDDPQKCSTLITDFLTNSMND